MRRLMLFLIILALLALTSCGGGNGGISGEKEIPQPVSVSILEDSTTVETGDTFQFHASVNNASDTTITWTVEGVAGGNATVGTMSVDGLYTAPASVPSPNPVTVKATSNADKSKSDTAKVNLLPRFGISPTSANVRVGETQQFTANQDVEGWRVNDIGGGNATAGTISATGLYTAPANVPSPSTVTVKAIEKRDNSRFATATVTILGLTGISISPTDATVPAGATQQFTLTPASADVTWEVSGVKDTDPSTWGTVSDAGLYTAPVTPPWTGKVNVKATLKSDTTKTANAVVTVVFSNATLNGHYAFRYRAIDKGDAATAEHIWVVGSLVADGKGVISSGRIDMVDINPTNPTGFGASLTGTYTVSPDGRTSATLTIQTPTGPETIPLRWVMLSNTAARMIGFDDTGSGWGNLDRQDTSAFAGGLSGTFVFSYDGVGVTANGLGILAAAGMFTAGGGAVSAGIADHNTDGTVRQGLTFTGSLSSPEPTTGRGTWKIQETKYGETWDFVYYMLSSDAFIFYMPGANSSALGTAVKQDASAGFSNASLNGNLVWFAGGYGNLGTGNPFQATSAGIIAADGIGNLTGDVGDNNVNGVIGLSLPVSGTYSISANGRGTMTLTAGGGDNPLAIYMISANQAVFVQLMPLGATTGQFLPQVTDTYNANTLLGSLAFCFRASFVSAGTDMVGQMTSDGAGSLTGKIDLNEAGTPAENISFTGNYTVSDNGRGDVAINEGLRIVHYVLYLASGRMGFLVPIDAGSAPTIGIVYRQF